jgi:hypothetical protein
LLLPLKLDTHKYLSRFLCSSQPQQAAGYSFKNKSLMASSPMTAQLRFIARKLRGGCRSQPTAMLGKKSIIIPKVDMH